MPVSAIAFARDLTAAEIERGREVPVVAFLASDDSSFVSGTGLLADGGYTVT